MPRSWPTAEQAVEMIHDAGGAAVVAHPYWDVSEPEQVRDLVASLPRRRARGDRDLLPPAHDRSRPSTASSSARSSGWLPPASSDFHGPTHKTFSRFLAYDTYGLGEPQVPPKP